MSRQNEKKILIVEDNECSLLMFMTFLKKITAYKVQTTNNGLEALKMAEQEDFDLIHMDVHILGLNGFETVKKLREMPKYKNVPIIIFSATKPSLGQELSIAAGANEFASIPIGRSDYLRKIQKYLSKDEFYLKADLD